MTGTIIGIRHAPMSGLATMQLDCGNYPCDAGPMFRSIQQAFGERGPIGQRISFDADGAMMTAFEPVEGGGDEPHAD